ncbi:SNF2 family DNA or RNA helicase [Desulfobotulus alkaliphilus]|uniref:SNF2 family DNA or RNA helicase n=1 Tax=Desulfobotulus alkaliphilus TaxID=622671 RepID=A0A562R9N8_9BACT|nr:DEAD/DEAH box helicase [Desulfobotulus alkaliphilus]TWI65757.1 SNF2 family DNA or RNA helicase [Desulfobotulus alkaliphilus]
MKTDLPSDTDSKAKSHLPPGLTDLSDLKEALAVLENLSPLERKVAEIHAINFSRMKMATIIKALAVLETGEKKPSQAIMIEKALKTLQRKKLLISPYRGYTVLTKPWLRILARVLLAEGRFSSLVESLRPSLGMAREITYYWDTDIITAEARLLLYEKGGDAAADFLNQLRKKSYSYGVSQKDIFIEICGDPFDPLLFSMLPAYIHTEHLAPYFAHAIFHMEKSVAGGPYVERLVLEGSDRCDEDLEAFVLSFWLFRDERKKLDFWEKKRGPERMENLLCLQGWRAFSEGRNEEAILCYEKALGLFKKRKRKRKAIFFSHPMGILYLLALIREKSGKSMGTAENLIETAMADNRISAPLYATMYQYIFFMQGRVRALEQIFNGTIGRIPHKLTAFFSAFIRSWADQERLAKDVKEIVLLKEHAGREGFVWCERELDALISMLEDGEEREDGKGEGGCLITLIQNNSAWENALEALLRIHRKKEALEGEEGAGPQFRMVWFIRIGEAGTCEISPKEQKRKGTGWTAGRAVALKRLAEERESFTFLTEQDSRICRHIESDYSRSNWYGHGKTSYFFSSSVLSELAGHPLLFNGEDGTPIELIRGKPELIVSKIKTGKKKGSLSLSLSPPPHPLHDAFTYVLVQESPSRFRVVHLDQEYEDMAEILGKKMGLPQSAELKVQEVMETLAPHIPIKSDIDFGGDASGFNEVTAESRLHALLSPLGEGLKLVLAAQPFGENGPAYPPGKGGRSVVASVKGSQMKTTRDLSEEKKRKQELILACPSLQAEESHPSEWAFPDTESALELLLELEAQKEDIRIAWPEGQRFRMAGILSPMQFKASIREKEDWFAISGSAHVDENLTLDLMALLDSKKRVGRFIALEDGAFVALTREFEKRLRRMERFTTKKGRATGFHPMASLALEGVFEDLGQLKTDKAWEEHLARIRKVSDTPPELPSTLAADLRDYQKEGFNWMVRLSEWGVGACLADDMGLGKTLQALAILIRHAAKGPSLVIAPTSVCGNWLAEARRFAPTLNFKTMTADTGKKELEALGPFDVLVCSYGRMQQAKNAEMLAGLSWQVAILDEAQAIKNMDTQRSKAAMTLQAAFRLILTGTPIENHLRELWNLFQFIVPGLLGSLESFNRRFALPIEKYQDDQAKKDLRRLVQPFILRRTKAQVLEELPPRTEVELEIDLTPEETAFYEALRRQALERIEEDTESGSGQKHIKILAEITRLRQACCHSSLVDKDLHIPSSKLAAFSEILDDLLENRHKALVFSQFLGHLALVREHLDKKGISYQYLDGSTPAEQRQKSIAAFQAGEGDVFLISLKAGGVGLNLTAADYVIHMDPWWNPAVENQASDRAHRIGQQRPVTIYRLVTKNTVEEKIVKMHALKRDLADSLLEGADMSAKMSADALLGLIREAI